jgi:hypothetical protein
MAPGPTQGFERTPTLFLRRLGGHRPGATTRIIIGEFLKFTVGNLELRDAATQTDQQTRKYPNGRLVDPFHSWKMDIDFGGKFPLITRLTKSA